MKRARIAAIICLVTYATVAGVQACTSDPVNALLVAAQRADADELLVLRDGVPIVRWTSGRYKAPHQLMSVTKSVVALALGKLMDDGKVCLNDRLERFFPNWRNDPRGAITVGQVLEQNSGLGSTFPHSELSDIIEEALRQRLLHTPGSKWFYNNDAVNLLSGIVEAATGGSLEQYVRRVLFEPLSITTWSWYSDEHGHTWVMTGLALGPDDLAKLGQLVLDGGRWRGKQIVSQAWVRRLSQRSNTHRNYGALWWVGFDFMKKIPKALRAQADNFIWAQGDANQLLVIDSLSKTVMVLQTELLARTDRNDVGGPIDKILGAYCTLTATCRKKSFCGHGMPFPRLRLKSENWHGPAAGEPAPQDALTGSPNSKSYAAVPDGSS